MTQAKMPPERMSATVGYMVPGSSAWVVPWNLAVDENGDVWVDANCPLRDTGRAGTVQLHLARDSKGSFHATLHSDYRYGVTPRERIEHGNYLPLSTFTDVASARPDVG